MLFGQFNLWVRVAAQAGGCFSLPSEDSVAYTELLFDICQQFGIHYYAATKKNAFCRGSDPCHLDETTGGELLYSPEHPLRFLHLTHILTHTGNLP